MGLVLLDGILHFASDAAIGRGVPYRTEWLDASPEVGEGWAAICGGWARADVAAAACSCGGEMPCRDWPHR